MADLQDIHDDMVARFGYLPRLEGEDPDERRARIAGKLAQLDPALLSTVERLADALIMGQEGLPKSKVCLQVGSKSVHAIANFMIESAARNWDWESAGIFPLAEAEGGQ